MYIEFHDRLGNPQRVQATRVVAYDNFGNPYALAISYEQTSNAEQVLVSVIGQDDFEPMLRNMGITKTVVVKDIQQRPLTSISF